MNKLSFANHPELVRYWDDYCSVRDFEDGCVSRVSRHLQPHRSETDNTPEGAASFANRQARLYNVNLVGPYLFLHWCHMSQPITLGGMDSDAMKAIEDDVTGFGDDYTQAARDVLWLYERDGRVGVLVDGPSQIADDRETARLNEERSYQVIYDATKIRDWEVFTSGPRKGQLSRLVLEQPDMSADGKTYELFRMFVQPPEEGALFQWFDLRAQEERKDYSLITQGKQEYEVVASGTGGLTEIPFVIMGDGPEESFAKDSWPLNKAWLNLNSVLSNIIYNQGFQRSIFSGISKEELTKMTEWTVTVVHGENAQIFTIPPGDPVAAQQECDKVKREAHRRAKFEFNQLADDTREVQSAESKSKDLVVQKVIYDNTLDYLEATLLKIYRFHAEFENENPDNITVSIARDYGIEDTTAETAEMEAVWTEARELGVIELRKEILKMRASRLKFLPDDGEDVAAVRARVLEAIDAAQAPADRASSAINGFGASLFGVGRGNQETQ